VVGKELAQEGNEQSPEKNSPMSSASNNSRSHPWS
jgi:hypothetical protein